MADRSDFRRGCRHGWPGYGATAGGLAFVTAYLHRSHAAFKKTVSELAWRSFAWFAAEPEHLLVLHDDKGNGRQEPGSVVMNGVSLSLAGKLP